MDRIPWLVPLTQAFNLGHPVTADPLLTGLIQQTWRITTTSGQYVAQALHPVFNEGVIYDGQAISTFLRAHHIPTPIYLETVSGSLHWTYQGIDSEIPELQTWRVMPHIPGETHLKPPTLDYLRSVGRIVGQMHQQLEHLTHDFQFQIPDFHNTPQILASLDPLDIPAELSAEATFFRETLPPLFLPDDLPQQVIHGDLKFSNFLFDSNGSVVAILDLDTFMLQSRYVELGDALRSWATDGSHFHPAACRAALEGYAESGALVGLDPNYLRQGLRLITLELGVRFLRDVVEDNYFQWDPQRYPSRRAHNIARCHRQIALYHTLLQADQILSDMLEQLLSSKRS